jgi:hypothetical protein
MKSSSQEFLEQLTALPSDWFEHRFAERLAQLGLGAVLERNDLTLLCEAALLANVCQEAINDIGGGKTKEDQETKRVRLEWEFMTARDIFYASPGWQTLDQATQQIVIEKFFTVAVADQHLAW